MSTGVFLKKEEYKRWIFFSVLESVKRVTCISPEVDPWHTPMQMRLIEVNGSTSKEPCFVKLPSFIL